MWVKHEFREAREISLLDEIHCFIEQRQLWRVDANLLAGLAVQRYLHPFLPCELGDAGDTTRAVRQGTLPPVRDLPGFCRLLPVAGLFHGQVVDVPDIARETEVSRTTVTGYLEILNDTMLAFRVPAIDEGLFVRKRRHLKLYWCDAGLARAGALSPRGKARTWPGKT